MFLAVVRVPGTAVQRLYVKSLHVGGTRCVPSSTDHIMNIQARITWTVECIRVFLYFDCMCQYKDEDDQDSRFFRCYFQVPFGWSTNKPCKSCTNPKTRRRGSPMFCGARKEIRWRYVHVGCVTSTPILCTGSRWLLNVSEHVFWYCLCDVYMQWRINANPFFINTLFFNMIWFRWRRPMATSTCTTTTTTRSKVSLTMVQYFALFVQLVLS